jgi:glycosyltransferase involved in cell wall biosynthesis
MEAVYCNTIPLLPKRLTYPELFNENDNPQLFYKDEDELIKKLGSFIENIDKIRKQKLSKIAEKYDWSIMAEEYDREFVKFVSS